MSKHAGLFEVSPTERIRKGRVITKSDLAKTLSEIEDKLNEGRAAEAEKLIIRTLTVFSNSFETQAKLNRLLSFALEKQGRYTPSLKSLKPFEPEDILRRLKPQTYVSVLAQLAIAYSNLGISAKALKLLNTALEYVEINNFDQFYTEIYVALARVHRHLNKYADAREYAAKGLSTAREIGDWYRMAEAYQVIAACLHQAGEYEKSLDYFHQAVKIVGEKQAPFLLGKIYSDMSATYWFLRRPFEGINFLEKAIGLLEETDQQFQATIAYHNLGINLMLVGEWTKAEEALQRSLGLAIENNHIYKPAILNSLGEMELLRGHYAAADEAFEQAERLAEKDQKESYRAQVVRNSARSLLAQENTDEAIRRAQKAIAIAENIGDGETRILAELVLAGAYVRKNRLREAGKILQSIEEAAAPNDYFALGTIEHLRGSLAEAEYDESLAAHHFSRSLSFFETAEDFYHTAVARYEYGRALGYSQPEKAQKHLASATDVFTKLGAARMRQKAEAALENLRQTSAADQPEKSVNSQLLMVRLAEAASSRELLFRELAAILQQESKAKKIIVAEFDEQKRFYPLITHGFTPAESVELTTELYEREANGDDAHFIKEKFLSVFQMQSPAAPPATLIVYPNLGETLADGETEIQPLLRVVELGMDVCALREKDKSQPLKENFNPFISQSLMPGFIHSSPAMTTLVEEVHKIRQSDVTVLITGESGTGKELVSRAIHTLSPRKDKIFIPFNCTAIPRELAEGYFFGYRRGTFTGAVNDSPGMIRNAEGGTLFLDEIGDLPLEIQPKLLRFLQEGEIQPLGEKRPIHVDVRIIAATNCSLEEKIERGEFREDLFYRLNVIRLHVPPLRERRSEVAPIVNYYVNHYSAKFGRRNISISPQAMDLLTVADWAGNVRQLCNEVQRLVARASDNETITPNHLSPELRRTAQPIPVKYSGNVKPITSFANILDAQTNQQTLEEAVADLETKMINESMRRHAGNISRVARELGLTRRGLYLKLDRYGLDKTGS